METNTFSDFNALVESMNSEEEAVPVKATPKQAPAQKLVSNSPNAPTILKQPINPEDPKGGIFYKVIFNVMFDDPDSVVELVDLLCNSAENDIFEITITSPGGRIDTLLAILTAMSSTKAKTISICDGIAASCGAILWAATSEQKMMPTSQVMFHSSLQFLYGKSLDIIEDATNVVEMIKNMIRIGLTKGYLTGDEFDEIFRLKRNVYITTEMFLERTQKKEPSSAPVEGGEQ